MRIRKGAAALALLVAGGLALGGWRLVLRGDSVPVFYGNVEIRQVDVGFRVGGRLTDLLVEEGDSVRAGDLLARLDDDTLAAQAQQAQAQLAREKANLQRLESGYRSEEIAAARAAGSPLAWGSVSPSGRVSGSGSAAGVRVAPTVGFSAWIPVT